MKNKIGKRFLVKSQVPGFDMDVIFIGMQETGFDDMPDFSLYNLTVDLPGHPTHSTVSREELEKVGFVFPPDAP